MHGYSQIFTVNTENGERISWWIRRYTYSVYLEEEDGNDEVIEGEPLGEVAVVVAKEEEGKD